MQRSHSIGILTSILVCLLVAAGAADLKAQTAFDAPDGTTPYISAFTVHQYNTADGVSTVVELQVFDPDGQLPGSVDTLSATGPGGFSHSFSGAELTANYYGDGSFWFPVPGAPTVGTFTVQVTDKSGNSATSRDFFGGGPTVPRPDSASMQASMQDQTLVLSWAAVNHPESEVFYRARIYEVDGENLQRIWSSGITPETSVSWDIPPGTFEDGKIYQWSVDAFDSNRYYVIDQRSRSDWVDLDFDNETPYFCYATVYVRRLADGSVDTAYEVEAGDPDGVLPGSIQSLTVTPPGGSPIELKGHWLDGFFWHSVPGSAVDGIYTFTVTDNTGNTKTTYDFIQVQGLGRVEATSLRATGNWPTPTLSWSAPADISGPTYYRVIIEDAVSGARVYGSNFIAETWITVPEGRLSAGGNYRWYVRTGEHPSWIVRNNENRSDRVSLNSTTISSVAYLRYATAYQRREADGQRYTTFHVSFIDPGGLAALSVSGPNGFSYTFQPGDYDSVFNEYTHHGPPDLTEGVYTFSLTPAGGGGTLTTHTYLKTVTDLPLVDSQSVKVSGDPLRPVISWAGIDGYAGQAYYRLWLTDENYNRVQVIGRNERTSASVSFDMTPGETYRFRVEAYDHPDWVTFNARSNSSWSSYTPPFPSIAILNPNEAIQADDMVRIAWRVDYASPEDVVRLFYDTDANPGGGVEITPAEGLSAGGQNDYDWNVSALAGQTYFIYATITGGGQTTTSYSSGTVTVVPDGIPLDYEIANGLDPYNNDSGEDLDGDGLTNLDEFLLGTGANDSNANVGGKGDVNADGLVDLADTILALQTINGLGGSPSLSADVDGDGLIGIAEAVFTLQAAAHQRIVITTSRDAQGVWYINGPEEAGFFEVFEAMGYAVATDRLWQAETFRRSGRGTLSEILGQSALSNDIFVRITGYSEDELSDGFNDLDSETQAMVSGYVAGFNRRIAEIFNNLDLLPFEFVALAQNLGVTPDVILKPWTVEDVLAWTSLMLRNFDPEAQKLGQLDNADLIQTLAGMYPDQNQYVTMFNDLRWANDPDALTYIAPGAQGSAVRTPMTLPTQIETIGRMPPVRPALQQLESLYRQVDANLNKIGAKIKMGSYAWAVAGDKTATGNPMIYSGPQMGFMTPSIIMEGAIRAGGLNISGMAIAGLPGIVIGRTPHHAWSMQVGHAHTLDFYFEAPEAVTLNRMETFKVAGEADVTIPVWKSAHGPIINPLGYDPGNYDLGSQGPIVAYKYSHAGREFATIGAYLRLAQAQSMDEFGAALEDVAVSQHFCYADRDGNIAYWMSGFDPNRQTGYGYDYRFPQGAIPQLLVGEWQEGRLPLSTVRNPAQGYVGGWNNKTSIDYPGSVNNLSYSFGPAHRAHVIDDYLSTHDNLTFEEVRDLALNIAATDSFGSGGNPWVFVQPWFTAAVDADSTPQRQAALDILAGWDGHFVAGGPDQWAGGTDRADAWILMDEWIREVIRQTFQDELNAGGQALFDKQPTHLLFNVLLHGLNPESAIKNYYNWFANASDAGAPQTADAIIVAALDNVLANLGERPWGTGQRGTIAYSHDLLGQLHTMPFSSRSTYAHVVEMGGEGPVHISSMFPLGASGDIRVVTGGPVPDENFLSMTPFFDHFEYRSFPLPR